MAYDFDKAKHLMEVVREAALHGTAYKAIKEAAEAELKTMMATEDAAKPDLFKPAPKGHLEQQIEDNNKKAVQPKAPQAETSMRKI